VEQKNLKCLREYIGYRRFDTSWELTASSRRSTGRFRPSCGSSPSPQDKGIEICISIHDKDFTIGKRTIDLLIYYITKH
jgi:hypothetical protein